MMVMVMVLPLAVQRDSDRDRLAALSCVTSGIVLLALARNLLERHLVSDAATIQLCSDALFLVVSLALARSAGLDMPDLGLSTGRLMQRLGGAVFLTVVLAAPSLSHGGSAPVVLAALPAALTVATIEELVFRGVLFALWQRRTDALAATVLTSLAFAASHAFLYPPPVLLVGLITGLLLATWRALCVDLVAPSIAHTASDSLTAGVLGGLA